MVVQKVAGPQLGPVTVKSPSAENTVPMGLLVLVGCAHATYESLLPTGIDVA